jgi:hypothetical protein
MDINKVNQLFEKICKCPLFVTIAFPAAANNLEIEERSVKNLAQKVQLKLLEPQDLVQNHAN